MIRGQPAFITNRTLAYQVRKTKPDTKQPTTPLPKNC